MPRCSRTALQWLDLHLAEFDRPNRIAEQVHWDAVLLIMGEGPATSTAAEEK
jgi:hypothetical protein